MTDVVRDEIVARLSAIPDIGIVHSYQRYAARTKQLADLYVYNGQLRGWFVRRIGQIETTHNAVQNEEKTRWLIRGYLAVNDENASELVFDNLLDAVRDAFKADWMCASPIGGVLFSDVEGKQAGLSIDEQVPVMFADALCHAAKCTLIARRYVSRKR